jgi:hypothetical protein
MAIDLMSLSAHTRGRPELSSEMHACEAGHLGKVGQGDALAEMRVDMSDDPLQPPLRQRRLNALPGQDARMALHGAPPALGRVRRG